MSDRMINSEVVTSIVYLLIGSLIGFWVGKKGWKVMS